MSPDRAHASPPTVYFDITTAAHWQGRAVGIVRVERELGRRAPGASSRRLRYCLYSRNENAFHIIDEDVALKILAGRLKVEMGNPVAAPVVLPPPPTLKQRLKTRTKKVLISIPGAFETVQRIRGVPIENVYEISARRPAEAAEPEEKPEPPFHIAQLHSISKGRLTAGKNALIVSGGLDWEYKDLRAIAALKKKLGFRYAAVLYDLIPLLLPHYVVPAYVNLLTDYFGELFWLADAAIAISETSETDAKNYASANRIEHIALGKFPLGSDLPKQKNDDDSLPDRLAGTSFGLFVSTIEPRKNHRVLYEAWHIALSRGDLDPKKHKLVFVGQVGWNCGDLVHEMENNPLTRDSIVRLSDVSDGVLETLYSQADFCLMPSHYEGYGLPLAEALRYGKPCLASPTPALKEIGGDAVEYIDAWDPQAWARSMVRLFNNKDERERRSAVIKQTFHTVDWDRSASEFFRTLDSLLPV